MFNNDWKSSLNSKTFDTLDINLFENYKFSTLMNYVFTLWGLVILNIAMLISDIYTCVKLLAFNSWSNDIIQPYLSFHISKWLFSGCILISIIIMIWDIINGIHLYKTNNISLTFINNFSRTVHSISNYKLYCVYNRITPKGTYQRNAFFTFFELKGCLKLLLADTPRQVINGLTLWSVLITINGQNLSDIENVNGLIAKIETIAQTNYEEAVLLSFMLFSFVIWAFFFTKLLIACIFSIYIYYKICQDTALSGLKEYVCIKINERVDYLTSKYRSKRDFKDAFKKGSLKKTELPDISILEKLVYEPVFDRTNDLNYTVKFNEQNLNYIPSIKKHYEEYKSRQPHMLYETIKTKKLYSDQDNTSVKHHFFPLNNTLSSKVDKFSDLNSLTTSNSTITINSQDTIPSYYHLGLNNSNIETRKLFTEKDNILTQNNESLKENLSRDKLNYLNNITNNISYHINTPDKLYFNKPISKIEISTCGSLIPKKNISREYYYTKSYITKKY